jgi:hypothetical protein
MTDWPIAAASLQQALLRAGCDEALAKRALDDLAPIFRSVENARAQGVEAELAWGLLAVAADRRAQHKRGRAVGLR